MLSGGTRLLVLWLALSMGVPSSVPAEEEPVDPGRRKSEQDVKRGVDAEIQKKIDQAIEKAKKYLMDGCTSGGATFRQTEADKLRQRAESYAKRAKDSLEQSKAPWRDGRQRQALLKEANSLEKLATSEEKRARALEANAKVPRYLDVPLIRAFDKYNGVGEEALVGLALVQSGVSPYDPVVQRVWNDQVKHAVPSYSSTYIVGIQLMLVDAMMHAPCGQAWPAKDQKAQVLAWVQKKVDALAVACDGGGWSYELPVLYPSAVGKMEIGSDSLVKAAVPKGAHDHSNTQFAVLGLKAAALCGVRPKSGEAAWRLVVQHFLNAQQEGKEVTLILEAEAREKGKEPGFLQNGWEEAETGGRRHKARARGWPYFDPIATEEVRSYNYPDYSMTTAGLTALLVGRSELKLTPQESAKVDEGVRDGLAWMQENWDQGLSDHISGYLRYGIERVGVLGSLRTIGGHNWYAEGADSLAKLQKADGSWHGVYSTPVETSFCLLFLTRGTREAYARPSYETGELPPEPPSYEIGETKPAPAPKAGPKP